MERTQIYLTGEERKALAAIAKRTGRTQSELIREAVDGFMARYGEGECLELLRGARGIWRGRTDLPDFEELRREFEGRDVSGTGRQSLAARLLLDTDVLIEYLRGRQKATEYLEGLTSDLYVSVVSVADVRDEEKESLERLLLAFSTLSVTEESARLGGLYRRITGGVAGPAWPTLWSPRPRRRMGRPS